MCLSHVDGDNLYAREKKTAKAQQTVLLFICTHAGPAQIPSKSWFPFLKISKAVVVDHEVSGKG